eukprot:4890457-Pyramimonas_sp.AAC.1
MESVAMPHQKSIDVLGSQDWVSRGRFLVVELLLYQGGRPGPPLRSPVGCRAGWNFLFRKDRDVG